MKSKKYRKWVFVTSFIIILSILLVPVRSAYRDGGTTRWSAITYTVTNYRRYWYEDGQDGFIVGTQINIFGRTVFDNTRFEAWETENPRS